MCLKDFAQRLQCSSYLVMTYFLLSDNILPEKELHLSPWVRTSGCFRRLRACGCGPRRGRSVEEPTDGTKELQQIPFGF